MHRAIERQVDFIAEDRKCPRCGGAAQCVRSESDRHRGVSGGTEYRFVCACGERFTIEGWGRVVFVLLGSPVLGAVGVATFSQGAKFFGAIFCVVAAGMFVQQLYRQRLRWSAKVLRRPR